MKRRIIMQPQVACRAHVAPRMPPKYEGTLCVPPRGLEQGGLCGIAAGPFYHLANPAGPD